MKKRIGLVVLVFAFMVSTGFAADPVKKKMDAALGTFVEGCQVELSTFCKDVTPGEKRILACLYAFADKVSPRCEYALYDSMGQLNRTLTNLSYTKNECNDDLNAYCSAINPGEGRILDCLNKNETKVSSRCNTALKDGGWKK